MLGHWERLFCHVMQAKSHGRRWKFRIAPLRRKIKAGYNPYLSDSESDQEEELEEEEEEALFDVSSRKPSHGTMQHKLMFSVDGVCIAEYCIRAEQQNSRACGES